MREGWKEVKLGEYYDVRSGLSKEASAFGSGYPFLSFKTVFNNYFIPDELKDLVNTTDTERFSGSIKKGDVFLTRTSETNDELGMSCVALKDYENATFNGFTKRLRPNENNDFNPKYVGFYLRSPKFRAEISGFSNLTTRASLNNDVISRLKLIVPPKVTQDKIASILSGYDDLIENNLKRIKILEEMAQQTYEEWFVRMRFPGYETAVFDENGLAEGWEKVKLGEWIKTSSGGTPSKKKEVEFYNDGTIPWVRTGELKNFILIESEIKITESGLKNSSAKLFPKGTVLLAMYGNTIGETTYCDFETSTNQACCGFLVKNKNESYFIHQYLLKNKEQVLSFRMGAAQENISQSIIQNMEIIKPSDELINEFGLIAKRFYVSIINLSHQNQRLRESRDILLPRLMIGMIDVENLESKPIEAKIIPLKKPKKEASKEFKEAVLIAYLTERFGSENFPLGRKRYTKLSYLFHRYSDNKIQDYLRKAAGPYNPKTKYGGPEKIALDNKYVQNWKSDNKMTGFVIAEKIEDAKNYFPHYWQIADLDWLTNEFKYKSNDELELLATVDNSLIELSKKNLELTTANVMNIIKSEKEWEAKLERTVFSDSNVERAIGFLRGVLEYN